MLLRICCYIFFLSAGCSKPYSNDIDSSMNNNSNQNHAYHFSASGDDKNDGSIAHPFKTISFLNALALKAGDSVMFNGGDIFSGNISLSFIPSSAEMPVVITSYGNSKAIIDAGSGTAISIAQTSNLNILNIICKGSGRKTGNTKSGILINTCSNVNLENIEIDSFQKSGLEIYCGNNIHADNIYAHDNGFAGIFAVGDNVTKESCSNIFITNSLAQNNPGDPTELGNHSGNGILAGFCKNVLIDHCVATNNGWDMPRIGNGPVGIWCYEADSVVIQHCISYENKTAKGADDGGGFDLDGGSTNCIIQYCLSYKNQGSAFGIFQYAGASPWHDNTIRFCISEDDGNVSPAQANAYIWNSSRDSTQFKNLLFYNNTLYNDSNAVINYASQNERSNFKFYNNIFLSKNSLITGNINNDFFLANDWWSLIDGFNINGNKNFQNWATLNNQEQLNGVIKGLNVLPPFKNADNTSLTHANSLNSFLNYQINASSPVMYSGIDLQSLFNINIGTQDFNGQAINKNYSGACTH